MLLAPVGVLAARPIATASQVSANARTIPAAASHARGVPAGRNPASRAIRVSRTAARTVRTTPPTTWPVRTAPRDMGMVRKRSMMPSDMSVDTLTADGRAPAATVMTRMPGVR